MRSNRMIAAGACLACLTLALVATPTAPARASGGRAAIAALLRRRAAAWLGRDARAFMATVSRADVAFRRRERRLFGRADQVAFASYRLVPRWDLRGDLASPRVRARHPDATAVATPLTEERYRLKGLDRTEAVEDLYLTFVREGGRWLVGGDSDLADVGLPSARHLWDFAPVIARSSPHFVLMTHPCGSPAGCVEVPQGFLGLLERALGRVDSVWTDPWPHRVLVLVPTTTAELGRIIQATFDLDNFVAFASASVDAERLFFTGPRVLLNWAAIVGRSQSSVLTILSHELLHVATRPLAGPFVPTFVDEGIAEYVGYLGDPGALGYFDSLVAAGRLDEDLPRDYQFLTGTQADIYTSYQKAQSVVRFFTARWGRAKLAALYRRLGRVRIAPGTTRYHLDRALSATIGLDAVSFQRAWADSIR
jgi:hypothetical protein